MTNSSLSSRFTSANVFPPELAAAVVLSGIWQFSKCFYSPFAHAVIDRTQLSLAEHSYYKEDKKKATLTLAFKWRVVKSTSSEIILSSEAAWQGWESSLESTLLWVTGGVWHRIEELLRFNFWCQHMELPLHHCWLRRLKEWGNLLLLEWMALWQGLPVFGAGCQVLPVDPWELLVSVFCPARGPSAITAPHRGVLSLSSVWKGE